MPRIKLVIDPKENISQNIRRNLEIAKADDPIIAEIKKVAHKKIQRRILVLRGKVVLAVTDIYRREKLAECSRISGVKLTASEQTHRFEQIEEKRYAALEKKRGVNVARRGDIRIGKKAHDRFGYEVSGRGAETGIGGEGGGAGAGSPGDSSDSGSGKPDHVGQDGGTEGSN